MSERAVPSNDHDLLVRIWTILEGTNGDGLIIKFDDFCKDTSKNIIEIRAQIPYFWTKEEHDTFAKEHEKKETENRDRRKMATWQWLLVIGALASPLATVIVILIH